MILRKNGYKFKTKCYDYKNSYNEIVKYISVFVELDNSFLGFKYKKWKQIGDFRWQDADICNDNDVELYIIRFFKALDEQAKFRASQKRYNEDEPEVDLDKKFNPKDYVQD